MEEGTGTAPEGPHKALLKKKTLDHIFSFLSGEDWKTARLVCQKWNSRVLTNFDKKLTFALQLKDRTVCDEDESSILASCDSRILLSSISMGKYVGNHTRRDLRLSLQLAFTHLRFHCSGRVAVRGLRVLELQWVDARMLDWLIGVANTGGLRGLEELSLWVEGQGQGDEAGNGNYKCVKLVAPGALPRLNRLKVLPHRFFFSTMPERCPSVPVLQSFVAAALNLESVVTSFFFDLSGRAVRELRILGKMRDKEVNRMLESVKESLIFLSLDGNFLKMRLPVLPNLTTLIHGKRGLTGRIDLTAMPELRRLESFSCSIIVWKDLKKLLLARQLKEVILTEFPAGQGDPAATRKRFAVLLNSGLTRLSLGFDQMITIAELQGLLWVAIATGSKWTENGRKSKSALLEFHNVGQVSTCNGNERKECEESPIRNFTWILTNLGNLWELVRFVDFKFQVSSIPSWREKELAFFGDRSKDGAGRITINVTGAAPKEEFTVCLETTK